jgi:predicted N-acetyltransferase YhbS
MLDRAFGKGSAVDSFATRLGHLFSDRRIVEHTLAVADGRIVGCVGCYPFAALLHGTPLTVAGIGQVATAPEVRRGGIMTDLLATALGACGDVDLFWLYGDRQRYGRVGFAPGGQVYEAVTWDRYAPPPEDGPAIRALDREGDRALLERALAAKPFLLLQDSIERLAMLRGKDAHGWTDGSACVLLTAEGRKVSVGFGAAAAVGRLVRHQVARRAAVDPKNSAVTISADPCDSVLLEVCRVLGDAWTIKPTAMFRVGRLLPLLSAWAPVCRFQAHTGLRSCVLDGGTAGRVKIVSTAAGFIVSNTTDTPDFSLTGAALAELVLGTVPPAACLPNLPPECALTHFLPLRFAIPSCYEL